MRFVMLALALVACTRLPEPVDPTERALFRDLEREVTVAEAQGWSVDKLEVEALLDPAMDSVCRVDELGRRALRTWLDDEISRRGGPVDAAWRARGKRLSRVDDLLALHRIRAVLVRADELSLDCPFWIEPELPFEGRQISHGRWQLTFGGGGKASFFSRGTDRDLSYGGAGRLLLGKVLDSGNGLYVGAELGGSASFQKDAGGARTGLVFGADLVAPVVYRYTLTSSYFELEGGWLGHVTERDWGAFDHGVHAGISVGGRALRSRFVFPGAAFGVSWEHIFLPGADQTTIKLGFRFAFDLDL